MTKKYIMTLALALTLLPGLSVWGAAAALAAPYESFGADELVGVTVTPIDSSNQAKQALIQVDLGASAIGNRKELPASISVRVNGQPQELRLNRAASGYEAVVTGNHAVRSRIHYSMNGKSIVGGNASPDFKVTFAPCGPGCRSFLFHTKCLLCVLSIEI